MNENKNESKKVSAPKTHKYPWRQQPVPVPSMSQSQDKGAVAPSEAARIELIQTDAGLWNVYDNGKLIAEGVTLEQWEERKERAAKPQWWIEIETESDAYIKPLNFIIEPNLGREIVKAHNTELERVKAQRDAAVAALKRLRQWTTRIERPVSPQLCNDLSADIDAADEVIAAAEKSSIASEPKGNYILDT